MCDGVVAYEDVVGTGGCILRDRVLVLAVLFSIGLSFSAVDWGKRMAEVTHKPREGGGQQRRGEGEREKAERGTPGSKLIFILYYTTHTPKLKLRAKSASVYDGRRWTEKNGGATLSRERETEMNSDDDGMIVVL